MYVSSTCKNVPVIVNQVRKLLSNDMKLIVITDVVMMYTNHAKFLYRSLLGWTGEFWAIPSTLSENDNYYPSLPILGISAFVKVAELDNLIGKSGQALSKMLASAREKGGKSGSWFCLSQGESSEKLPDELHKLLMESGTKGVEAFAVCKIRNTAGVGTGLSSDWLCRITGGIVPYSKVRRKKEFRHLEAELKQYLDLWRNEIRVRKRKVSKETD